MWDINNKANTNFKSNSMVTREGLFTRTSLKLHLGEGVTQRIKIRVASFNIKGESPEISRIFKKKYFRVLIDKSSIAIKIPLCFEAVVGMFDIRVLIL